MLRIYTFCIVGCGWGVCVCMVCGGVQRLWGGCVGQAPVTECPRCYHVVSQDGSLANTIRVLVFVSLPSSSSSPRPHPRSTPSPSTSPTYYSSATQCEREMIESANFSHDEGYKVSWWLSCGLVMEEWGLSYVTWLPVCGIALYLTVR
jgi:hypothetical protein